MNQPGFNQRMDKTERILWGLSGLVLVIFLVIPYFYLQWSPFDPAELENLQASWLVHQGWVPYRDFFEHHAPFAFQLLALQFNFLHPAQNPDLAVQTIFINRMAFWTISIGTAILTGITAGLWKKKAAGLISVIFLLSTAIFFRPGAEIHPEGIAGFLWSLLILILFLAFTNRRISKFIRFCLFFIGGGLFALAILTTQELVWMIPWLVLLFIPSLIKADSDSARRNSFIIFLLFLAGFSLVFTINLLYFNSQGVLIPFLNQYIQEYRYPLSPLRNLLYLCLQQPVMVGLALFGFYRFVKQWHAAGKISMENRFYLLLTLGMVVSILWFPAPHQQYFIFLLPLLAIPATATLSDLRDPLREWFSRKTPFFDFHSSRVLVLIICLISTLPGLAISGYTLLTVPREPQPALEVIRYVISHSNPDETILDGRTGAWLFRPVPWYYWVQHTQVAEIITPTSIEDFMDRLERGVVSPRFANLDANLERYPDLVDYIRQNYLPLGIGDLWEKPAQ